MISEVLFSSQIQVYLSGCVLELQTMLKTLQKRELDGSTIKVALVGAGSMGLGIAHQLKVTPGMTLVSVFDIDTAAAQQAAEFDEATMVAGSFEGLFENGAVDVLVESSNSIQSALRYCEGALDRKAHVVLMNAEVDLAFGPYLKELAENAGVVVTSDAGDQHGVLASMIEEITLWGFDIVQAGNVKGFLDRDATAGKLAHEAEIRNLNPIQCCAYTDGSKLNIEMAVLANGFGYAVPKLGMTGPRLKSVEEVMESFDWEACSSEGEVDYILGAEPGGGVYVVGKCDDVFQQPYLKYYKLIHTSKEGYYLFYRPYHLCHLETPKAIFEAVVCGQALLSPTAGRKCEVYAYAKADFPAGTVIEEAIGGDVVYGMIEEVSKAGGQVPQVTLACEGDCPELSRAVVKGDPILLDDVNWPDRSLLDKYLLVSNQPGT